MRRLFLLGVAMALAGIAGCSSHKGPTNTALKPQAFLAPTPTASSSTSEGKRGDPAPATSATATAAPSGQTSAISQEQTVTSTAAVEATTRNGSAVPATASAMGVSSGTYMIVGTVLAEANGQPIYAEKVLAKIDAALAAKAKSRELDPRGFRRYAEALIRKQLRDDVALEMEIAAALRNTTDEEQLQAKALTSMWRIQQITKAGGSLAVTKRLSLDNDGIDFDQKVDEQYRRYLVIIYFQRRVEPRVQVSGDDMRAYYDRNLEKLYTEKAGIRFRVVQVGIRQAGSTELAARKAQTVLEKAKRGEHFENLAKDYNDNALWKKNGGFMDVVEIQKDGQTVKEPAWYQKGSMRLEKLEKALFALNVGELTDIIDGGDAYYIAKLEQKQVGRVRAFEDESVQNEIRMALSADQRKALRDKEQKKLEDASFWHMDEALMQTAVEMAMQKYATWARAE